MRNSMLPRLVVALVISMAMFIGVFATTNYVIAVDAYNETIAATTAKPLCSVDTVVVTVDSETPCNLTPPQSLVLLGTSQEECSDMGGTWVAVSLLCADVDY